MITVKKGDIFRENVEMFVNPVNTVGISGAGLALQFKNRFPKNFKEYNSFCKREGLRIGEVLTTRSEERGEGYPISLKYIVNFPTKNHYSEKSELSSITQGLQALGMQIRALKIKSIALPMLGCGLGQLGKTTVLRTIKKWAMKFDDVDIRVLVL